MSRALLLRTTHGNQRTEGAGTVIVIDDRVVWFTPAHGVGRLKFPLRMLPDAEPEMRIRFVQLGDTIQKVERVS